MQSWLRSASSTALRRLGELEIDFGVIKPTIHKKGTCALFLAHRSGEGANTSKFAFLANTVLFCAMRRTKTKMITKTIG
jgi:hypothetical protein